MNCNKKLGKYPTTYLEKINLILTLIGNNAHELKAKQVNDIR